MPTTHLENRPLKVLLVGAGPALGQMVEEMLVSAGKGRFQLIRTEKIENALTRLEREAFDAAVLDAQSIAPSDGDRFELIRRIPESTATVVMADERDEQSAHEATRHGAQDCLVRGEFDAASLTRALRGAVQRQRRLCELRLDSQSVLRSEANFRQIVSRSADGLLTIDGGRILYANPACERLFGCGSEDLIGHPFEHPLDKGATTEIEIVRDDGGHTIAEMCVGRVLWEGEAAHVVSLRNITARRMAENMMINEAAHDGLTGLYNRRVMMETLEHEINRARRYDHPLCVLILDLDHFKKVNDVHGHLVGDKVLAATAQTLSACSRSIDVAARYGGEEFCVIMPETELVGAQTHAARLHATIYAIEHPAPDGATFHVTCSIGIAALNPAADKTQNLLEKADQALYQAKSEGRNRICLSG